jgi:hypothetical protein
VWWQKGICSARGESIIIGVVVVEEEEEELVVEVVMMIVVVVVIFTVEDGYIAAGDHDYDCDGDGGGKIIFGYLPSSQVPLTCLQWFWCCEISCFHCSECEVLAQSKDLVVVFLLPHEVTWLP